MVNAPIETMQLDFTDQSLETLKAQELQAREDLRARPDDVFYQNELKAAREAVRSYIQKSQEANAASAQQWHELRMRNAGNAVGLAQVGSQENVAHHWIGANSVAQFHSVNTSLTAHSLSLGAMNGSDRGYFAIPIQQSFPMPSLPSIQPPIYNN